MQAFLCDQGKFAAIEELMRQLPSTPDVLICNAALGTATVESYVKERHDQDLALLQVARLVYIVRLNCITLQHRKLRYPSSCVQARLQHKL